MNKDVRHYKIRYSQKFMGEILDDSYDKWCTPEEAECTISRLYEDPHVFCAEATEIKVNTGDDTNNT